MNPTEQILHNVFLTSKHNIYKFKDSGIVFHNRQRIGDILMFTCAVRDFKKSYPDIRVNVLSTASHIWDNNPNIDRTLQPFYKNGKKLETITHNDFFSGDTNVVKIGPGKLTNMSNRSDLHFSNAYRISIEDALKIKIEQGLIHPDIWFTEEEFNAPRVNEKPYWIIIVGGEKGWGCKMYPFERWQNFINQNKDILFYQLGSNGDNHQRLQGDNVIDYIGKTEDRHTGIRDLFKLFLNAEGSIGLVSFHMHLSAALHKPCIVLAGAREPVHFTRYVGHRYLATDGCSFCSDNHACWHCDINSCEYLIENKSEKIPKCVDLITPEDITKELNLYYLGGRLSKDKILSKPKFKNIQKTDKNIIINKIDIKKTDNPKYIKIISTARGWGGCSRSVTTIMKYLMLAGHKVEFIPFRNKVSSNEFKTCLQSTLKDVIVTENYNTLHEHCDVILIYADDYIWEFSKPEIIDIFSNLNADKKIMMLNYRRGGVGEIDWTKRFDKYMFLNSNQEKELLSVLPNVKTKVLPPCTELEEFFKIHINFKDKIKIVRHNSQGDSKFDKNNFKNEVDTILDLRKDLEMHMMPGPSFIDSNDRFIKYPKNHPIIPEFLSIGNLFWYSLPVGYLDMGPRVILEAMACGLPILADNWGGATDRVTEECGWLCNKKEDFYEIIKNITLEELEKKGNASRERAKSFTAESWIEEII